MVSANSTPDTSPRYVQIAGQLIDEIAAGTHPVGHKLPSEAELCARFGSSRSTVRQALGRLEAAGLIERRQGAGATVVASRPAARFSLRVTSGDDILRYAQGAVLEVLRRDLVGADDARRLHLGDPGHWRRWQALRRASGTEAPLGLSSVYLRRDYEAQMPVPGSTARRAVFESVLAAHGLTLNRIEESIDATVIGAEEAAELHCPEGAPALLITRRFISLEAGLFEVAECLHPADRFRYELSLDRERTGADQLIG